MDLDLHDRPPGLVRHCDRREVFFRAPRGPLVGATLGGSTVKLGWVGCGFCLELLQDGRRITTTRIREFRVITGAGPAR